MREQPSHRLDSLIDWIEKRSFRSVTIAFVGVYCGVATVAALAYFGLPKVLGYHILTPCAKDFQDCLYFSFVTQLTIGYGDVEPIGLARGISVVQTLLGVMLAGVWIGIAILKLTSPARNSIVFAKSAYYCAKEAIFVVSFVNANRQKLIDAKISHILKLCRENHLREESNVPYIARSVWFLSTDEVRLNKLQELKESFDKHDGIKVCISGDYGFAKYAVARKYVLSEIIAVEDLSFEADQRFDEPSLNRKFWEFFNDPVPESKSLVEYLEETENSPEQQHDSS